MRLAGLALGVCVAAAAAAGGAPLDAGEDAGHAERERIEAQRKADLEACRGLEGNARDICRSAAKGRARVAEAELQAQLHPDPETVQAAKDARADADYALARQRCDDAATRVARRQCRQEARDAREAAVRLAKVEKVRAISALQSGADEAGTPEGTPQEVASQRYAAAKARCVISGSERDACLAQAKREFGQP